MRTSATIIFALSVGMLILFGCTSRTDDLIAQLDDMDPSVRRAAVRALADHSDGRDEIITALTTASGDTDVDVREIALSGLGSIGSPAASSLPALGLALADSEPSVRVAAALAIQKVDPRHESFAPVLIEALHAGHGPVFLEVGRMGADGKWAVPTLVKLLSHRQAAIRALAAQTLGEIGVAASDAESSLQRSLRDPAPTVRRTAEQSLRQIQSQPAAAR